MTPGSISSNSTASNSATAGSPAADAAPVIIRASCDDDVDAMLDIYRRHIARGVEPAFAHDPEALQPEDIKRRRRNMRKRRLPHLVADRRPREQEGRGKRYSRGIGLISWLSVTGTSDKSRARISRTLSSCRGSQSVGRDRGAVHDDVDLADEIARR